MGYKSRIYATLMGLPARLVRPTFQVSGIPPNSFGRTPLTRPSSGRTPPLRSSVGSHAPSPTRPEKNVRLRLPPCGSSSSGEQEFWRFEAGKPLTRGRGLGRSESPPCLLARFGRDCAAESESESESESAPPPLRCRKISTISGSLASTHS